MTRGQAYVIEFNEYYTVQEAILPLFESTSPEQDHPSPLLPEPPNKLHPASRLD